MISGGLVVNQFAWIRLTHLFAIHPYSNPWKHQKILRSSDVFRGWRKGALGTNRIIWEANFGDEEEPYLAPCKTFTIELCQTADFFLQRNSTIDVLQSSKYASDNHCVKSVRIRCYSGPYFPEFRLNTERYERIQSECGKIQTRITPNTDTFHTLNSFEKGPNFIIICGGVLY